MTVKEMLDVTVLIAMGHYIGFLQLDMDTRAAG